jgi:hypothetical protein
MFRWGRNETARQNIERFYELVKSVSDKPLYQFIDERKGMRALHPVTTACYRITNTDEKTSTYG